MKKSTLFLLMIGFLASMAFSSCRKCVECYDPYDDYSIEVCGSVAITSYELDGYVCD